MVRRGVTIAPMLDRPLIGKKILVTGATGFVGARLCTRLGQVEPSLEVHAVSRREPPTEEGGTRWWRVDLCDSDSVATTVSRIEPDVIFHLAGHAAAARERALVLPTLKSNLLSTVNVLLAAGDGGCRRVVLAGSMEEPGSGEVDAVATSPYAVSKWSAGAYARMFHALYGLPVVVLRIFMVYGPAQPTLDKLVPYVIRSFQLEEAPRLSSGDRLVDWVYVDDVVGALLAAGAAEDVDGRTIDVGSGRLISIRQVVETIARIMETTVEPQFGSRPDRPLERMPVADPDDAWTLMGWRASMPLEEGLRRTVEWLQRQPVDRPGRPIAPSPIE